MKILIDKYVPFVRGVLEQQGAIVRYLEPEEFTPATVRDADALIIRTRTRCNAALLDGSRVRFIATATIGYDHIDRDYCAAHDIYWTNCPGCNAQAVCDYIEEALTEYFTGIPAQYPYNTRTIPVQYPHNTRTIQEGCTGFAPESSAPLTIGIVGVGHVGSLVAKMAERHGLRVLLNDPPKGIGVSLDDIARECDIITFHTPLIKSEGPHQVRSTTSSSSAATPTYHLCDKAFLDRCKPGALIINAARGGIVDENALIASGHPCIIDTWEGEPALNRALLNYARLASYHIAGYSLQGKINASNNCLSELCTYFGLGACGIDSQQLPSHGDSAPGWLSRVSEVLKSHPENFEFLRESYALR